MIEHIHVRLSAKKAAEDPDNALKFQWLQNDLRNISVREFIGRHRGKEPVAAMFVACLGEWGKRWNEPEWRRYYAKLSETLREALELDPASLLPEKKADVRRRQFKDD